MISVQDVVMGLKNPVSAGRYTLAYLSLYQRLSRFLSITAQDVRYLYGELEKDSLIAEVTHRYRQRNNQPYHASMLSPLHAPALYVIVRTLKPQSIVETGVCTGISSSF